MIGPAFTHGLTYQENMWAEHLARLGHIVRMFYAGQHTEEPVRIEGTFGAFEAQRVQTRFLPRSTYRSSELRPAVRAFQPQLIVVHGDKLFAKPVVTDAQLGHVPLVATFSENLGMHEYDWRKRGISLKQRAWAVGFRLMRGGPIRAVCRRATLLVGNTPQARSIVLPLFADGTERQRTGDKLIDSALGFSPEHFGFEPQVRAAARRELGLADDEVLVCASSHLDAVKTPLMIMIVEALDQTMSAHPLVRGLIVGFSRKPDASPFSRQLQECIEALPMRERFIQHKFAGRERLAQLYNAADIAVFGRASISCQEALGTGLLCCFADDGAVNHLVKSPHQALWFRAGDRADLAAKLAEAVKRIAHARGPARQEMRQRMAQDSRWLGYDRIIRSIMEELECRTD